MREWFSPNGKVSFRKACDFSLLFWLRTIEKEDKGAVAAGGRRGPSENLKKRARPFELEPFVRCSYGTVLDVDHP